MVEKPDDQVSRLDTVERRKEELARTRARIGILVDAIQARFESRLNPADAADNTELPWTFAAVRRAAVVTKASYRATATLRNAAVRRPTTTAILVLCLGAAIALIPRRKRTWIEHL
jgi:hypothetical protein